MVREASDDQKLRALGYTGGRPGPYVRSSRHVRSGGGSRSSRGARSDSNFTLSNNFQRNVKPASSNRGARSGPFSPDPVVRISKPISPGMARGRISGFASFWP